MGLINSLFNTHFFLLKNTNRIADKRREFKRKNLLDNGNYSAILCDVACIFSVKGQGTNSGIIVNKTFSIKNDKKLIKNS